MNGVFMILIKREEDDCCKHKRETNFTSILNRHKNEITSLASGSLCWLLTSACVVCVCVCVMPLSLRGEAYTPVTKDIL